MGPETGIHQKDLPVNLPDLNRAKLAMQHRTDGRLGLFREAVAATEVMKVPPAPPKRRAGPDGRSSHRAERSVPPHTHRMPWRSLA